MFLTTFCASISTAAALLFATTAFAADPPQQKPGDWTVKDFRFHTGEVLPELKLYYVTIGEPTGEPVLVLHGSNGSGQTMLGPNFAGELFGPGQPLDAAKYFLIVPDALGSGQSSKPSNGLRMAFPKFTYEDQVRAQYRLLTEHLGVKHLKLIIGQSMGGMHAWMWGEMYSVDGRHACLDVGRDVFRPDGCTGAHGLATRRHVGTQLGSAPHADRRVQGRSRLEQRQLH